MPEKSGLHDAVVLITKEGMGSAEPELQKKLLVDNPMRLYWPEESK